MEKICQKSKYRILNQSHQVMTQAKFLTRALDNVT